MKIIDHKDAINRRLYKGLFIVKTAIYRVSCLNRTVLRSLSQSDRRTFRSFESSTDLSASICVACGKPLRVYICGSLIP
ncbi:hypothetical protein H6G81_02945 [Scytonema hofmannii FACHB-248]|uniref:Transposase n=1 Tax=Scytonema hofmannii FACHB-248 TaxID=1842502 RepID=A0ABR8GJK4_9CYAN|nr:MULTISPECIES: hypothetical protein [Nostocales]MBD2603513.1 hypothetical protein [Scytonema hofmannii FACHB-248]